jgi:hypothetical protein
MNNLNGPRNMLEGNRTSGRRGPQEARRPKVIKEEGALILQHSDHLTKKLIFAHSIS